MAPAVRELRLCVLGPTTVERTGRVVPIGGRLPRRLLTVLAAGDGAPVAALVEAMWDGDPPPQAGASVHAYVSRLRRALGCAGRDELLVLRGDHYALRLPPGCRDTDELDQLLRLTGTAAPAEVVRLGDRARQLHRGAPYVDAGPCAEALVAPARAHYEEGLLGLAERRLGALLDLGQMERAIGDLRQHVAAHPLREHGWVLLILALYRAGRQADALAECRALRALLDTELGIRPGPGFQALETAVLRQDPRLLWAQPEAAIELLGQHVTRPQLPLCHGRFIGREAQLAQLEALAAEHDLVTVHGPGGVGKTRLVLEWAQRRIRDGDPVWFAGLKAETNSDAVAATVAHAIGAGAMAGDPLQVVSGLVSGRSGVLVLDNGEHVLPGVIGIVEALRGVMTSVTVVVTTRTTLDLAGEAVMPLDPLPVDGPGSAVELLRERIRDQRPGWLATDSDQRELGRLARALDGLPLALELAAARSRAQSLADLAGSIDGVMAAEVPRGSVNGHDTLAAAIDWSLGLLSDEQRALVVRLWPFAGGFTVDAVDEAFDTDSLPMLADLVAKSVIVADTRGSPTRFWLLETVRSRCRQLDPDPEASQLGQARWVRSMAWRIDAQMCDRRSAIATRRLRADLPNIEAAFRFDLEHSAVDALRTVTEINCWWPRAGQCVTALQWLDLAMAAAPDPPAGLAAKAHLLRAIALVFTGGGSPEQILAEADLIERLIEPVPIGDLDGDHVRGEIPYLRSLVCALAGDFAAGRWYAEECELIAQQLGTTWLLATVNTTLAAHDLAAGDTAAAFARIELALRLSHRIGMRWGLGTAARVLAAAYLEVGRPAEALASAQAGLRHAMDDDDSSTSLSNGVVAARALAAVGEARTAAVVADGVRDWARRAQQRWDGVEVGTLGDLDLVLERELDPAERAGARRAGAELEIEELLVRAATARSDVVPDWRDGDVRVPASLRPA